MVSKRNPLDLFRVEVVAGMFVIFLSNSSDGSKLDGAKIVTSSAEHSHFD